MMVASLMMVAWLTAVLAAVGIAQGLAGALLTLRFARRGGVVLDDPPAISVLKPLHGDEPLLEAALSSICRQDYPRWQVVFGVQDSADPAVAVVQRLRARFPDCDIALVVDPAFHGTNRKVGNLINMLKAARHDVLVIADSDLHVQPDYLRHLAAALDRPGVGLVTTLYAGLPAEQRLPALLGATQITHGFLPGAVLARALGRQDCLGATMCLRRETLARIGGLRALVNHLADDNVMGQLVRAQGLGVALAGTVPLTTVPETSLRALFRHELRWARTIRALASAGFAASVLQYPLFWAALTVLLAGGAGWSWAVFGTAWLGRATAGHMVDRALAEIWRWGGALAAPVVGGALAAPVVGAEDALALRCPIWLLPLRDLLSVAVMLTSYAGTRVDWRGFAMHADRPDLTLRPTPDRRDHAAEPRN
jgi:ceramide glucosyltransferase